MLSVLSSGTLHLSEELGASRLELQKLRSEREQLLDALDRRQGHHLRRVEASLQGLASLHDGVLVRRVFMALRGCRQERLLQLWRPSMGRTNSRRTSIFVEEDSPTKAASPMSDGGGSGSAVFPMVVAVTSPRRLAPPSAGERNSAWLWLWRRKLLCVWRRATHLERLANKQADRQTVAAKSDAECGGLMRQVLQLQHRIGELEARLASERQRGLELEGSVAEMRATANDLRKALREAYEMQFQEASRSERLSQQCEDLAEEKMHIEDLRQNMTLTMARHQDELARSEVLAAEREQRLAEASDELCLAEEVIDDIASSKCIGLRRFFERYNLPAVVVGLFRKVLELQAQLRMAGGGNSARGHPSSSPSARGGGSRTPGGCSSSPLSGSPSASPASPQHASASAFPPSSPTVRASAASPLPTFSAASAAVSLEAEVRYHMCLRGEGVVSRNELQTYVESLHLNRVSSAMVSQVVLALLGLDLGEQLCEASRMVALLAEPPAWERLAFATSLWGAAGDPAALVVRQLSKRPRPTSAARGQPSARPTSPSGGSGGAGARHFGINGGGGPAAFSPPRRDRSVGRGSETAKRLGRP